MQVIRTIIWVLILVGVVLFSFFNWRGVEVTIWENLVLETKVPALVIVSFLLGFLPTWLYARGVIWSLNRKIRSLEIAAKANSVSAAARESDREEAARQDEVEPEPEPDTEEEHPRDGTPEEEDPRPAAEDAPAEEPRDSRPEEASADDEPDAPAPTRDRSTAP